MKPARFVYRQAGSVAETLSLLAELGTDARVLAGGQSLVPLMNFRLARPSGLVDLNGVTELVHLSKVNGTLRVGAMVRQRQLERHELVAALCPLICQATSFVAHPQVRNRGTLGGSIAHADPSAEYPAVTVALEAEFVARSGRGDRIIAARDFFTGPFMTALLPNELLVEIRLPTWPNATAFLEVARRHGDFAIAGVAVALRIEHGHIARAGIGLAGVGPTPLKAEAAERLLIGGKLDTNRLQDAAHAAMTAVSPQSDIHGSAEYRKNLVETLTLRALRQALNKPLEGA